MANIVISIDPHGTATYLCNQYTEGLFPDAGDPIRASHVVPMGLWKYLAFKALRAAFGEDSRVGAWTRTWSGNWYLDLSPSGGYAWILFESRAEAIEFEINWLNTNFLGRSR